MLDRRLWLLLSLTACGLIESRLPDSGVDGGSTDAGTRVDAGSPPDSGAMADAGPVTDAGRAVTAANLLTLTQRCVPASSVRYATDVGVSPTISICTLTGAFFWKADLDVDCDGKVSAQCSSSTDPAFQSQTSLTDSHNAPLDAASLPYVVVPLPSTQPGGFDYQAAGLHLGAVALVIYNGQLAWGVFGDEGPEDIIGEASYAMAQSLGIDPNPSTGGHDGVDVTYIVFTGTGAVLAAPEDHAAAVTLGQTLATQLLSQN
jgi:hypothetical protein